MSLITKSLSMEAWCVISHLLDREHAQRSEDLHEHGPAMETDERQLEVDHLKLVQATLDTVCEDGVDAEMQRRWEAFQRQGLADAGMAPAQIDEFAARYR